MTSSVFPDNAAFDVVASLNGSLSKKELKLLLYNIQKELRTQVA